jgi:hypothetical protein
VFVRIAPSIGCELTIVHIPPEALPPMPTSLSPKYSNTRGVRIHAPLASGEAAASPDSGAMRVRLFSKVRPRTPHRPFERTERTSLAICPLSQGPEREDVPSEPGPYRPGDSPRLTLVVMYCH